jgi:hypothetical protein
VGEALQIFSNWNSEEASGPFRTAITATPVQCFRDGCISTVTYPNEKIAQEFNETFPRSNTFNRWQGAKAHTALDEMHSGEVVVAWAFFRPGEDR